MALQVTGQAQGPLLSSSQKSGSPAAISTGWHNEVLKSDLLPRYGYLTLSGVVFTAGYASAATAAASATSTGAFCLFNPANSGKNLIVLDILWLLGATPAASTTPYTVGVASFSQIPTSTSAGNTPICTLTSSTNTSVAKEFTAGTLVGANTGLIKLLGAIYVDLAAGDVQASVYTPIDGGIVVGPGSGIDLVSPQGSPTIFAHITYAELPI